MKQKSHLFGPGPVRNGVKAVSGPEHYFSKKTVQVGIN